MLKVIPFIALVTFSLSALADDHENSWSQFRPTVWNQFEICSLLPGKSIVDMAKLDRM